MKHVSPFNLGESHEVPRRAGIGEEAQEAWSELSGAGGTLQRQTAAKGRKDKKALTWNLPFRVPTGP